MNMHGLTLDWEALRMHRRRVNSQRSFDFDPAEDSNITTRQDFCFQFCLTMSRSITMIERLQSLPL